MPWIWSPDSGWLYLFPTMSLSDGIRFFQWESVTYLHVDRKNPSWANSILDGWIPWNREAE
jgi:hypothetical protein